MKTIAGPQTLSTSFMGATGMVAQNANQPIEMTIQMGGH